MIYPLVVLAIVFLAVSKAENVELTGNSTLGVCGYSATCTAGGKSGVCVSIGSGCCNGGTATSGLCPGNIQILINLCLLFN